MTAIYIKLSILTWIYIISFLGFLKVDLKFGTFIKFFQDTAIHPPFYETVYYILIWSPAISIYIHLQARRYSVKVLEE